MKYTLFLLLVTQIVFYSHATDALVIPKIGIKALIAASKKDGDVGINACLALNYLWAAHTNKKLRPTKDTKLLLKEFEVDKSHPSGTLKKVMDTNKQTPVYRFIPHTKPKEIKQPQHLTVRGRRKKKNDRIRKNHP